MIPATWRRSVVAVVGLGKSGVAATRLLAREGVPVYASDAAERPDGGDALAALRALPGVEVELGRHDLAKIRGAAAVVVSPGVPPDAPPLAAAREARVPVVSEIEIGFAALEGARCIAITGTNGKTTTTALVAHVLEAAGVRAAAVGNIGRPLADIAVAGDRYDWLAVEVSSFQLHDSPHFAPDVGVLTNLAPDHLDRYPSVAAYYDDKRLLFHNATAQSVWVLNADDAAVLALAQGASGRRVGFSLTRRADGWDDGTAPLLQLGGAPLLPRRAAKAGRGPNMANPPAAARAAARAGRAPEAVVRGLGSFRALPHRLEPVRGVGGVLWINDSKATNIASTSVAGGAVNPAVRLLLGGRHKGGPYPRPPPPPRRRGPLGIAFRGA